jgi:hypothetical protein
VTFAAAITDDLGQLVRIASATGGTKTFTGAITDNFDGDGGVVGEGSIHLATNTGATITFSGGLSLSTGGNAAFNAAGGGTVNVCALNPCGTGSAVVNRLATTTGIPIFVQNTNIGASNLTFQSIGANGAPNGIRLDTTGSAGGLVVTGTGAASSGGTIASSTGIGVNLTSTSHVNLSRMTIQNSADAGIKGISVNNFALANSSVLNNGNSTSDEGIQFGEFSGATVGVTGTVSITNCLVNGNAHNNFHLRNTSGTIASFTVSGSSFNDLNDVTGANAFLYEMSGTATTTTALIQSTSFVNNSPQRALEVQTHDTGLISSFTVLGSTFTNNGIHASFTQDTNSNLTFSMLTNNMTFADPLHAINVFSSSTSTGGTITGTIQGNTIGNAAQASSGAKGNAIRAVIQGRTAATLLIDNNTIRQVWLAGNGARGVDLQFLGPVAAGQPITQSDLTVTNNNVDTMAPASSFPLAAIHIGADDQGSPARVRANITGNTVLNSVGGGSYDYPTFDGSNAHLLFHEVGGAAEGQLVDTGAASANANAQLTSTNTGTVYTNGISLIPGPINTP